ncbi:MAG: response regulator [Paludibacter sp.]|jgi:response regulator RpfG family c-di-GMP phosphodiesterase|nr:MAG: response regulator [Paludibacter sp.]
MMKQTTILYVDDESLNLLLFKMNFEKKFNVLTCESGQDGLELLRQHQGIQVVISDMKMPHMNGIEFISKAHAIAGHLNYYILTGFEISDEIQEALDSGQIRRYFQKPFNVKEICEEIEEVIGN